LRFRTRETMDTDSPDFWAISLSVMATGIKKKT